MATAKVSNVLHARAVSVANETSEQKLHRAKGYPYARPSRSFTFINGVAYEFESSTWKGLANLSDMVVYDPVTSESWRFVDLGLDADMLTATYTPVLAIGSNAAPEQLRRKFPASLFPDGIVIPVVECVLEDFDVVYCPALCGYGACPATLEHCPGTSVSVYVTYLAADALQRMHETEGTYDLLQLSAINLHMGVSLSSFREGSRGSEIINSVYQYNHQDGTLHLPVAGCPGGVPVSLAEIPALNRRFPALTQPQMLQAIRYIYSDAHSNPDYIHHVNVHAESSNIVVDISATGGEVPSAGGRSDSAGLSDSGGASDSAGRVDSGGLSKSRALEPVSSSDVVSMETTSSDGTTRVVESVGVFQDQHGVAAVAARLVHLPGSTQDGGLSAWVEKEGLDEWVLQVVSRPSTRWEVTERMVKCAKAFRYQNATVMAHLG